MKNILFILAFIAFNTVINAQMMLHTTVNQYKTDFERYTQDYILSTAKMSIEHAYSVSWESINELRMFTVNRPVYPYREYITAILVETSPNEDRPEYTTEVWQVVQGDYSAIGYHLIERYIYLTYDTRDYLFNIKIAGGKPYCETFD